jgi:hypothetical protein
MKRYRIKVVGDSESETYFPQVWRTWFPIWLDLGIDDVSIGSQDLETAKNAIDRDRKVIKDRCDYIPYP